MNTNRRLIGVGEKVVVLKWQDGMGVFCDLEPVILTKENTGVVLSGKDLEKDAFEYTVNLNNDDIFTFKTTSGQLDYAPYEYMVDYKDRVPKIEKLSIIMELNDRILERSLKDTQTVNMNKAFVEFI